MPERGASWTPRDPAAVLDHRLGSPSTEGPLPWLDGIPRALSASPWGDYLQQRARLVEDLAAEIHASADAAPPTWAAGVDETLRRELAVWRAAYGVPDSEPRPSGPRVHGAGAAHQSSLDSQLWGRRRISRAWTGVLPAAVLRDPRRGPLYTHLDELAASGADVGALVDQALAGKPLPTEVPADALHWRLTGLTPIPAAPSKFILQRAALQRAQPELASEHQYSHPVYTSRPQQDLGPSW